MNDRHDLRCTVCGPGNEAASVYAAYIGEFRRSRPLSVIMAEKLQAFRDWAKGRTVAAD